MLNVSMIDGHIDGAKMSDEEIIKALEDLLELMLYEGDLQRASTIRKVFDLIKRKDAEIERFHKLQKPTETSGFRIENGKVVFYTNILNGYRHECKDLEEVVKELNLLLHEAYKNDEILSHYKCVMQEKHKAQAQAIKEFAERLKEKADYFSDLLFKVVEVDEIDNLVKEMVGDDK